MMKSFRGSLLAAALVSTCLTGSASAQTRPLAASAKDAPIAGIAIPTQEFTLPNGLRVVVIPDHTLPTVAVAIWYNVGAANEAAGHTGFAHLFEHLMYQGSEHAKGEFFTPFQRIGATDQNGSTNYDWTNYYETVPTPALDMALWMESDRMGHLLGAIDQATLDEQRGVVQNEKRQRYDAPYGLVPDHMMKGLFPAGHPYNHAPIGSMADLNAASLADVKGWFQSWYGPNNATLMLAGDIDLPTAREKAMRYFGDLAPTATLPPPRPNLPVHAQNTREIFKDRVPQARLYRAWVAPDGASEDSAGLTMLSYILGIGGASRLKERLVQHDNIATDVGASYSQMELAGTFQFVAALKDGTTPAQIEAAFDDEVRRMVEQGPTQAEVTRARQAMATSMARALPKLAARATFPAMCATYGKPATCWRDDLEYWQRVTPEQLRVIAARWLTKPSHTIEVQKSDVSAGSVPEAVENITRTPVPVPPADPKFHASGTGVDRSTGVPAVAGLPNFTFPAFQNATLSNGIKVKLIERHNVPLVSLMLTIPGGSYEDWAAGKGKLRSKLAMEILPRGTATLNAVQYAARQEELGASISAGDAASFHDILLDAFKAKLPESLDLLSETIFHPGNDPAELARLQDRYIAGIRRSKVDAGGIAGRVARAVGNPPGSFGAYEETEADYRAVTAQDLIDYQRWATRPDGATFYVVGDTTLAELVPLLEARFGARWKPMGAITPTPPPLPPQPSGPRVFLVDLPGAQQSRISVSEMLVEKMGADMSSSALGVANGTLGGGFMSRLNLNIREDKHWAYGASSTLASNAIGTGWSATAPVQADKTADAMREIQGEIMRLWNGQSPITPEDVQRQKDTLYSLPGAFDTNAAVIQKVIIDQAVRGLPDDSINTSVERLKAMTPELAQQAFVKRIDPNHMTWIVVGPLAQMEAPIRALNLGEVTVVDTDGKPVKR